MNEEFKENYIREGYFNACIDIIDIIIKDEYIGIINADHLIEEIIKLCKK